MNIPLVNAYGCLQTSQVFLLLWASQVERLEEGLEESLDRGIILHTNLDEYSVSCPSIYTDERGGDRAPLGCCISDMYLKRKMRPERVPSWNVSDLVLLLLALGKTVQLRTGARARQIWRSSLMVLVVARCWLGRACFRNTSKFPFQALQVPLLQENSENPRPGMASTSLSTKNITGPQRPMKCIMALQDIGDLMSEKSNGPYYVRNSSHILIRTRLSPGAKFS